jgi:hypothetical protein
MELFSEKVCGDEHRGAENSYHGLEIEWSYPFDLVEAAEHALSQGNDPFWRAWLELYEKTWAWTPEPPDPLPNPYHWRWIKVWAEPFMPNEGKVVARFEKRPQQGE